MDWQISPSSNVPSWLRSLVREYAPDSSGEFAAQLLRQRGFHDRSLARCFLDPHHYQPSSPQELGEEMGVAVDRIELALKNQEKIAIWGDFDADGVTATAVLWEGLGQWFTPQTQLSFFIPDRLKESHGLSESGLDQLAAEGVQLIITCDTGCTNHRELAYAQTLGMEVIVTDHHTLPSDRPPVVALINPRSLPVTHPLAHLSGVAVAYKLVEALYDRLPRVETPLENLLDLVVIGLIADLVELKGDCRYLAQKGLKQLQSLKHNPTQRPGVSELLELCRGSGDRPTDISFGIGPRINAVSRVIGDARVGVELLTSRDAVRCKALAEQVELLNTRRKGLQQTILQQAKAKLVHVDWSTTAAIILAEIEWPVGLLGLVAGQLMQEYDRPVILLSLDASLDTNPQAQARGSGRSRSPVNLYDLLDSQKHLLSGFGGHPLAAGLSLPARNLPLLREGIQQNLANRGLVFQKVLQADLSVTVADLNLSLVRELRLLDPYGMGNPEPLLLMRKVRFKQVRQANIKDRRGHKISYIKSSFELWDESSSRGVAGVWWGHYSTEIPQGECDVLVVLGWNIKASTCEVRLQSVRPTATVSTVVAQPQSWVLDYRRDSSTSGTMDLPNTALPVKQCPRNWAELGTLFQEAQQQKRPLALVYASPSDRSGTELWHRWVGLVKHFAHTQAPTTRSFLQETLDISDRTLDIALWTIEGFGFEVLLTPPDQLKLQDSPSILKTGEDQKQRSLGSLQTSPQITPKQRLQAFLEAVEEERFRQRYFATVPAALLENLLQSN